MPTEIYGPVGQGLGVVAGLISINADITPGQSLIQGNNITITDGGGGNHTIDASGLQSINADTTEAQLINGLTLPNTSQAIAVTNPGGGDHRIDLIAIPQESGVVNPPGVLVPAGVNTLINTTTIPEPGWWVWTLAVHNNATIPGTMNSRLVISIGLSSIAVSTRQTVISANIDDYAETLVSYLQPYAGGETVNAYLLQDSVGDITVGCKLDGLRFGS